MLGCWVDIWGEERAWVKAWGRGVQWLSKLPGCGAPQGPGRAGGGGRWALCMTPLPEGGPEVGTSVMAPTLTTQQFCLSGSESAPALAGHPVPAKQALGKATLAGWEDIPLGRPTDTAPHPTPPNGALRDEPGPLPRPSGLCPAGVLVCSGC